MSKSTRARVNDRAVVIQRGRELAEFVSVLEELAVPVDVHDADKMPHPDDLADTALVIVAGSRLVETGTPNLSLWPRTLAVVDGSGRTLTAHLNRLGVSLIIRRPIHSRTLRLLLLHEIYRGPERRHRKRILVGHPIRVGAGLFKQNATLLEISPGGARIELPRLPKIGSRLQLLIGKDLTLGKPLKLPVKVVRCIRPSSTEGRRSGEIGVALLDPKRHAQAVAAILDRFKKGPAAWSGKPGLREEARHPRHSDPATDETATDPAESLELAPAESDPGESSRRLPPSHAVRREEIEAARPRITVTAARARVPEPAEASDPKDATDRRSQARIPYDQRVVALDEEAARVLVGRDLSRGGMRIESSDTVSVGDTLRVALHSGTGIQPLIVLATALRDDGDDGTVLVFRGLSRGQLEQLDRIIAGSSPIHANLEVDADCESEGASIVLGEMLEKLDPGASPPDQTFDSGFDAGESVEHAR